MSIITAIKRHFEQAAIVRTYNDSEVELLKQKACQVLDNCQALELNYLERALVVISELTAIAQTQKKSIIVNSKRGKIKVSYDRWSGTASANFSL